MPRQYKARIVAAIIAGVCATGLGVAATDGGLDASRLSAGVFTLDRADSDAYQEPAPVLDFKQMQKFLRGRHHFNQKWVQFPSLGGDWGLGPTFIADKCSGCHVKAGRGTPPNTPDQQLSSLLVRISVPGEGQHGAPQGHPAYGDQIQKQGLMGQDRDGTFLGERVPPEAELFLEWEDKKLAFADGEEVTLRKPRVRFGSAQHQTADRGCVSWRSRRDLIVVR